MGASVGGWERWVRARSDGCCALFEGLLYGIDIVSRWGLLHPLNCWSLRKGAFRKLARSTSNPPQVSKPRKGELPTWWSEIIGIRCPKCGRPQSPRKMGSTNPHRGHNRTDFHMCGGCGNLLYLTGERRLRRFFLLDLPVFFGVGLSGYSILRHVDGLNIYREAREAFEPNFLGFFLICAALYVSLSMLARFEIVGIALASEVDDSQANSNA